jgi:hypothetical protein
VACNYTLDQGCYACNYENSNECLICSSWYHQKEPFKCELNVKIPIPDVKFTQILRFLTAVCLLIFFWSLIMLSYLFTILKGVF